MEVTFLEKSYYLDYDHPSIQSFVHRHVEIGDDEKSKAISLYHAVRDHWRYNPLKIHTHKEDWRASEIIERVDGHCLDKSIILVACLRAVNLPARLHLAKVKNHIAVERIIERFGHDELTPHGMVDILLDGRWVKVSPAFNKELCDKLNVHALDFDGENDSIFQQFSKSGALFMEYIEDYGSFEDVPLDFIFQNMQENYGIFNFGAKANGVMYID
jgi:transglutaminase-like putative cysteine protease